LLFIIFVYKKWRQKIIYTTERGFPSEGERQKETKKGTRKEHSDGIIFHAKKRKRKIDGSMIAEAETLKDF